MANLSAEYRENTVRVLSGHAYDLALAAADAIDRGKWEMARTLLQRARYAIEGLEETDDSNEDRRLPDG